MNRLLYPNGGREIFGDDLQWENEVLRDAVSGFLSAFCPDTARVYILSGLEYSAGAHGESVISSGYIALNGEIYRCAGYVDRLQQGLPLFIEIVSEFSENRMLRNRQILPTRELRYAKIVDVQGGNMPFGDAIRVNESPMDTAGNLILPSNLTAPSDVSQRPRALKRGGQDLVKLYGRILVSAPISEGGSIGLLPSGLRPVDSIFVTAHLNSVPPVGVLLLGVEPNGRIFTPYYIGAGEINLNNTIFY
jgi:hypothetical protein